MMRASRVRTLTRMVHNYVGLYFLLFIWLFSVSGLVLNHPPWAAAQFWRVRNEQTGVRSIRTPVVTGDVALAADLMAQLGLVGEINETKRSASNAQFEFQVVKPGRVVRVQARLDSSRASVTMIRLNGWGVVDALHKFTGVKMDDPTRTRDWILTRVWSLSMDALAVGLACLVLSGLYLWYRRPGSRRAGLSVLGAGVACCAFFLYGLGALLG